MTNLSTANKTKLNNSMRAAQNVALGDLLGTIETGSAAQAVEITTLQSASATHDAEITAIQTSQSIVTGSAAVTAVHANASAVTINTGIGAIKGFTAQISRSGSFFPGGYALNSSGSLIFGKDTTGSYAMTTGDFINYMAWRDTSIVGTGSATVTEAHVNASAVTLDTSLGSIKGFTAQLSRSGSLLPNGYVLNSSGSLVFGADSTGSYVLTEVDSIFYFAWQ